MSTRHLSEVLDEKSQLTVDFIIQESVNVCEQKTQWYANLGKSEAQYLQVIMRSAVSEYMIYAQNYVKDPAYADNLLNPEHLFSIAPLETTSTITFDNVIDAIRITADVTEKNIHAIAPSGLENEYIRSAIYYSRETAFSAAQVYGRVAATRSMWDTRDEALIIESLLNNDYSSSFQSRAVRFSWDKDERFFAIAGNFGLSNTLRSGFAQANLRSIIHKLGGKSCISTHDDMTILLISTGKNTPQSSYLSSIQEYCEEDSTFCYSSVLEGIKGAGKTLRAAVHGFHVRHAYPDHLPYMSAHDLLAERALLGDTEAQDDLYNDIYLLLKKEDKKTHILSTIQFYLFGNRSIDDVAHTMKIHPNTIRYRLKKSHKIIGYDVMLPRDAYTITVAIKIGLYRDSL